MTSQKTPPAAITVAATAFSCQGKLIANGNGSTGPWYIESKAKDKEELHDIAPHIARVLCSANDLAATYEAYPDSIDFVAGADLRSSYILKSGPNKIPKLVPGSGPSVLFPSHLEFDLRHLSGRLVRATFETAPGKAIFSIQAEGELVHTVWVKKLNAPQKIEDGRIVKDVCKHRTGAQCIFLTESPGAGFFCEKGGDAAKKQLAKFNRVVGHKSVEPLSTVGGCVLAEKGKPRHRARVSFV